MCVRSYVGCDKKVATNFNCGYQGHNKHIQPLPWEHARQPPFTNTCVHAHGVHIFDGADDDHVVIQVTHHFQLKLLPPDERDLNEYLEWDTQASIAPAIFLRCSWV